MTRRFLASVLLASFLAACATNPGGGYGDANTSSPINKQTVGGLAGAGLGGLAGAQFGKGSGRLWTTGAGVLLGALAGSSIGSSLDKADQTYANQAYNRAATAPVGQTITWNNPDSGNSGTITPTRSGVSSNGLPCREFTQKIVVGGQTKTAVGTACQNGDGTWQVQQ